MQTPTRPYKRSWRNLLIKREFQLKIGLLITLALLILVVVFLFQTFMSLNFILKYGVDVSTASRIRLFQMIFGLGYAILIFLFSIYVSHKIAGPLYRLEKDVRALSQDGDLTRVFRLRRRDELKEMVEALNALVNGFRAKLLESASMREHEIENINQIAQELAEGSTGKEEKLRRLKEMTEKLSKVDETYFRVQ